MILFLSCFSFKLHLYAAQHFVHTPCMLMPQRGLCTVLEEEEEERLYELSIAMYEFLRIYPTVKTMTKKHMFKLRLYW